jgi:phosphoglycerate dehydrogenase-like enzyme
VSAGTRPDALVVMDADSWAMLFDRTRRQRLHRLTQERSPAWLPSFGGPAADRRLTGVEVLLTGWGAPLLDTDALNRFPDLRAVLHCGGSVRPVVTPQVWERGIVVSSSADLNAGPVAEFTLAAFVMAGKKVPFLAADARRYRQDWSYRSTHGTLSNDGLTIGVVGFSRIGRRVVRMAVERLRDVTVLVSDPYADPEEVRAAGATLTGLEEMLPRLDILSIHAPDLPSTRQMIAAPQLAALPDHATVINTARGALIDTDALTAECLTGRLHAMLDVTDPEPLPSGSPLYDLPNVMLTPHVAGSLDSETFRMADGALDELERFIQGLPLVREVDPSSLAFGA